MASLPPKFLMFYLVSLLSFSSTVLSQADCHSYGVDFFDAGGPYFINTASPDDFSFTTVFRGCTGETVTPLLIAPNTDEFFCSDIQTTPNGEDMVSICNVPGNEVPKSSIVSGTYTIIIEGLDFAWMRSFEVVAGIQSTVTSTPTAIFNITTTPIVNTTTTITQGYNSTLSASTTTLPSATETEVSTITPPKVTTTSTNTKTVTRISRSLTVTVITKTKTVSCDTQPPKTDPTCTIHPKKLEASKATSTVPASKVRSRNLTQDRRIASRRIQRSMSLARRDADLPTTTVFETTYTASVFNTLTAPTTTDTFSVFTTTTNIITPPPVTVASGITHVTSSTTLPAQTRTFTTQTVVTSMVTKVLTATITSTTTVVPANGACTKT